MPIPQQNIGEEEDNILQEWEQDEEFRVLPPDQKEKALHGHFDEYYSDDAFKAFPAEKQAKVKNNFVQAQYSMLNPKTPETYEEDGVVYGFEEIRPGIYEETGIDLSELEPKTPDLTLGRVAGRIGAETKRIATGALGSILGGIEAQESLREKRTRGTLYEERGVMPPETAAIGQQYDETAIQPLEPRPGAIGQQYDIKPLLGKTIQSKALQIPEKYKTSSGWLEDVFGQIPQFGALIGSSILNPALGISFIGSQIMGSQYLSLREEGAKPERAFIYSLVNALTQSSLEGLGVSKIMKAWKPQKNLIQKIRRMVEAGGTEWLTETAQAIPEAFTNLFALNPDKKMLTNLDTFLSELPEALKEGAYEGTVVLPLALLGAGMGQANTSRVQSKRKQIRKAEILIAKKLKEARAQKDKARQEILKRQQDLLKAARIKLGETLKGVAGAKEVSEKKATAERKIEERRIEKEERLERANREHEEKIRRKIREETPRIKAKKDISGRKVKKPTEFLPEKISEEYIKPVEKTEEEIAKERKLEREARLEKAKLEHEKKIRQKIAAETPAIKARIAAEEKLPQEAPKLPKLAPKVEKKVEEPTTKIKTTFNFPTSPQATKTLVALSENPVAEKLSKNVGIEEIVIDKPHTFELSQDGAVTKTGKIRLNPNASEIDKTYLHEIGHLMYTLSNSKEKSQLNDVVKRNIELLKKDSPGYAENFEKNPKESVSQIFSLFDQLSKADQELLLFKPTGKKLSEIIAPETKEILPKQETGVGIVPWDKKPEHGYDSYITGEHDLRGMVKKYGDRMLGIKDVNGGRHHLPASVVADLMENPLFSEHVRSIIVRGPSTDVADLKLDTHTLSSLPNMVKGIAESRPDLVKQFPEFKKIVGKTKELPAAEKKVAEAKEKRPAIPELKSTNEALEFGKKATPEQMGELARLKKESNERFTEMRGKKDKSTDDLQALSDEATRGQFYREAIEWKEVEKQGEAVEKPTVARKEPPPEKAGSEILLFVKREGGIHPDYARGEQTKFSIKEGGYPGLVNRKSGRKPDDLRSRLEEEGYLQENSTITDLWNLLDENLRQYKSGKVLEDAYGKEWTESEEYRRDKEIAEAELKKEVVSEMAAEENIPSENIKELNDFFDEMKEELKAEKAGLELVAQKEKKKKEKPVQQVLDVDLGRPKLPEGGIKVDGKAKPIEETELFKKKEPKAPELPGVKKEKKVAKEKPAEVAKPAATKPPRPYKKGDTITYKGKQFKVLKVDAAKDILKLKGKYTTFQTSIKKAVDQGYEVKEEKAEPQFALETRPVVSPKKKPATGTPIADINKAINPIISRWKKVAGVTPHVKVAQDISELPLQHQDRVSQQAKEGKIVKGFYDSKENTVFLLSKNLKSVDDALQTLAHETFNHAGLEKIVGKKFYDQIWKSFIAKDKAIFDSGKDVPATNLYKVAKDYKFDLNTAKGRRDAVKEKLGRMAKINDNTPLMRRVLRSIKVWLRKMGFNFKVTDSELMGWLAKGKRAVETGKIKKAGKKVGVKYAVEKEPGAKPQKPLSKKEKKELNHLKALAHRLAPVKEDLDAAKIEALGKIKSMAGMDIKEARAVIDALKKKGREVQTVYEEVIEGISKRKERKETRKAIKDWEEAGEAITGKDIKEIHKLAESKNLTKADIDDIVRSSTREATTVEELDREEADILKLLIMDREKVVLHGVESFKEIDKSAAISKKTKEKLERAIRIYDVDDLDLIDYALQYQKGDYLKESEVKDIVEFIKITNEIRPGEDVIFPYFTPVKRIFGEKFIAPFRHMALKVQESSHPLYEESKKIFKGLGKASRRRITEFREGRLPGEKLSNEEKRASNAVSKIYDNLWEVFEIEAYIEKYNPRRPSFKNKTQLVNWVFSPQGAVKFDFWAEHARTGQLSKTEKDSLRLLQSYITVGFRHKYGEEAIEKIQPLLDSFNEQKKTFAQSWINTVIKKHPTKDEKVGDVAISRLMRGIEVANEKTTQKIFKKAGISVSQNPRLYRTFVHELQSANYSSFMGLRPKLGIRNALQQWLIINEYKLIPYLKGRTAGRMNQEVKIAMELSDLVQIRKKQYQVWEEKISGITDIGDKARDAMMVFYRAADVDNVKTAFATGYMVAKKRNPNASDKDLIRAGEKAITNTQWGYGIDLPVFFKSPTGKLMGQYSSWCMWYFDHMHRTVKERKGDKAARTAIQWAILAFVAKNFDYDYLKTVLLGVIPTGIGVIPSKLIVLAKFLQAVGVGDKRNIKKYRKEAWSSLLLFVPGYLAHKDMQKAMDEGIEHLFFYKKKRTRKEIY